MSKGDIILISFPFTDLSGQKVRPALVLYSENKGKDCIVAFITSGKLRKRMLFDIKVSTFKLNGLKDESVIKLNKIVTLDKKIAIRYLGSADKSYMAEVNRKLKQLFRI